MEYYICQFQFEPGPNKRTCGMCYHAYPHKQKKNCKGKHCKESNINNESIEMKDLLTCQPLIDTKDDSVLISNVKYAKAMAKKRAI